LHITSRLTLLGWGKKDAMTLARFAQQAVIGRFILSDPPLSAAQNDLIFSALVPK